MGRPHLVAAVVAALAVGVSGASAQAASHRISTEDGFVVRLGPWKVKTAPLLSDAERAFGPAAGARDTGGACRARWTTPRLSVLFTSFGDVSDFCGEGLAQSAVLRGRIWVTWAGLRVGMPTSQVRARHRRARFERGKWILAEQDRYGSEPSPTVSALVRDGRVSAFSVFMGRAGD